VIAKYDIVTILDQSYEVCDLVQQIGKQCPIPAGVVTYISVYACYVKIQKMHLDKCISLNLRSCVWFCNSNDTFRCSSGKLCIVHYEPDT